MSEKTPLRHYNIFWQESPALAADMLTGMLRYSIPGGITQNNLDDVRAWVRRESGYSSANILAFSQYFDRQDPNDSPVEQYHTFWLAQLSGGRAAMGTYSIYTQTITMGTWDNIRNFIRGQVGYPTAQIMAVSKCSTCVSAPKCLAFWSAVNAQRMHIGGVLIVDAPTDQTFVSIRDYIRERVERKNAQIMALSPFVE